MEAIQSIASSVRLVSTLINIMSAIHQKNESCLLGNQGSQELDQFRSSRRRYRPLHFLQALAEPSAGGGVGHLKSDSSEGLLSGGHGEWSDDKILIQKA